MRSNCHHTILASWTDAIVSAVEHDGNERDELFTGANVYMPANKQAGARLPHDIMRPLWTEACRLSGDYAFPVKAAKNLRPTSLHNLSYCVLAAESLNDVCRLIRRNFHVISTAAALKIDEDLSGYRMVSVSEPTVNDEGFEMFMVFLVLTFRCLFSSSVRPASVTLRRDIPNSAARERYKSFFDTTVEFSAPRNSITFPRQLMYEELDSFNPAVREYSENLLKTYLKQFGSGEFKTLVRSSILELMVDGNASEEAVARSLSLSRSSLARRLREEGTTYRQLFNDTQLDLALQLLKDTELPLIEISFRLGYHDLSSFSRSFRRWTGISPREWRRCRRFETNDKLS